MIFFKTNSTIIGVIFLGIILALQACDTQESFTFEKQQIPIKTMLDCSGEPCASLTINLLKIEDNNPICKKINQEIESVACAILNTEENESPQTLTEAIRKFDISYKDTSTNFPGEIPPYEAAIDCELSFQCKSMVSILMDSYIFTGGAHGYGSISFINLDCKTGVRIDNKNLFKKYIEFEKYAERVFRSEYDILENESINSTGFFFEEEKFTLPENIGFTNTHVILYYNPYEISSYAEGPVEVKMKKEDVASYFAFDILSP